MPRELGFWARESPARGGPALSPATSELRDTDSDNLPSMVAAGALNRVCVRPVQGLAGGGREPSLPGFVFSLVSSSGPSPPSESHTKSAARLPWPVLDQLLCHLLPPLTKDQSWLQPDPGPSRKHDPREARPGAVRPETRPQPGRGKQAMTESNTEILPDFPAHRLALRISHTEGQDVSSCLVSGLQVCHPDFDFASPTSA